MAWYNFFLIVSLALVIALLPISINGIGLRENTFVFLLGAFGILGADALAFSWRASAQQFLGDLWPLHQGRPCPCPASLPK